MVRKTLKKEQFVPKPLALNEADFQFNIENNSIIVNNTNVTIVGDYNNPFFAGKEICEALGYRDVKEAFNNVKPKHKSTLHEIKKVVDLETTIFLWPFKKELSYNEGKTVYISEHGAYHLAMNSLLPIGDEFRDWLADDVIPSLRRAGQCKLMKEKEDKLSESLSLLALKEDERIKTRIMLEKEKKEREEAEERVKVAEREKEAEKKERKIAELRSLTLQSLHVSYQERFKTQVFYIVTSKAIAKDNEFKIGGVENSSLLKKRLSMYNTGNSGVHPELTMFFVFLVEVSNYKQMESRMKELLAPFRSKRNANTENFNIHFKILKPLIEMVSENYNEEIDKLNGFVKALLETHTETYLEPEEMVPINPDAIPDQLDVNLVITKRHFGSTQKTNISDLNTGEIKVVLEQILERFSDKIIHRSDIEKVLSYNFVISSHKRRIWDLAKPLIEDSGKVAKY